MQNKKNLIVLILRMLETLTDSENTLTQVKIAEEISSAYPCDRKTVGRNIKLLKKLGYPIVKTKKGYYMDKMLFTRKEVQYVIDAVRNSPVPIAEKDDLCDRLFKSLSRYYSSDASERRT